MSDDTIVTPVLEKAAKYWRKWVPWALTSLACALNAIVIYSVGYGQQKGTDAADRTQLIAKVDGIATDMKSVKDTLQAHGERLASMEATSAMTLNDVHDLKTLADHAQDVADKFKVQRFNNQPLGHRVRKP